MHLLVLLQVVFSGHPLVLPFASAILAVVYFAYHFVSHPLRHLQGPLLLKVFPGWIAYHAFRGTLQEAVLQVHKTYGDVVCVGPTTILARTPEAVTKVLGYGANHLSKSSDYGALVFHTPSVFSETNKQAHTQKRRIAAQAYSMNSIVNLEKFVDSNVDKFVKKLDTSAATDQPLDLCEWFKFYAFDVIGDLAFGRSFGMMERGSTGEFVTQISSGIEFTFELFLLPPLLRPLRRFLARWTIPGLAGSKAGFQYVQAETMAIVSSRWDKYTEDGASKRADILGALMDAKDPHTGLRMAFPELATNASTNVVAGSDTLTITLTAIVYYLLHNPSCARKLVAELDIAVKEDTIAVRNLLSLPYLDACIKEAMRLLAPFGGPMPRVSPAGGMQIDGQHIPENIKVCVMHDAVHFDERVYPQAKTFYPERWLDHKTEDMERCFLGFSTGPRSCLGKNVALLEMKKLLIRLFTQFELSLVQPQGPISCRRYLVTKSLEPVMVRVGHRSVNVVSEKM